MPGTPGASQIRSNQPGSSTKSGTIGGSQSANPATPAANADAAASLDYNIRDDEKTLSFANFNRNKNIPNTASYLSYPQNLAALTSTDYVRFIFKNYKPPFKDPSPRGNVSGYNASIMSLENDATLSPIALYMPEDIQAQYATQWGGKSIQNLTGSILQKSAGLASGDLSPFVKNIGEQAGSIGESVFIGAVGKALEALQKTGQGEGLDKNDIFSTTAGVVINPNSELLFQGFDLRNFNLSFKLVATNTGEAETIRKIITTIKKAMLPKLQTGESFKGEGSKDGDTQNFIGVPSLVQVQFMQGTQENPWVTQFKPCAITSLNINYTPDGAYATYYTGAPVSITMDIGFAETKLVYREDIFYGGPTF
jgi:hypothetical protein